jgi:hypothetical protein
LTRIRSPSGLIFIGKQQPPWLTKSGFDWTIPALEKLITDRD